MMEMGRGGGRLAMENGAHRLAMEMGVDGFRVHGDRWRQGRWVLGGSGMEMGSGRTGSAMEMNAGCTGVAMENEVLGIRVFKRGDGHRPGHRVHGGWS